MTLRIHILSFLILTLASIPSVSNAGWQEESKKIEFLLVTIESSSVTFFRNGETHSGKDAANHLRMKLQRAQSSWFAPPKEEWTALMFIDKISSESSFSGKEYYVIFEDGRWMKSRTWLMMILKKYPG